MPPHRFSSASCARFYPVLDLLCREQPPVIEVGLMGLSTATVAARLRDAILAYLKGLHVGPENLLKTWANYQVVVEDNKVLVRRKGTKVGATATSSLPLDEPTLQTSSLNLAVLKAYMLLVSEKEVPSVLVRGADGDILNGLAFEYDINLVPNPDGSFTIC